jgi:SWI/SNF-related matrix-associated actin-dependent regulator 1 of chromatin subfamily A
MSLEKTIHACLGFLFDSNEESKEWLGEGFLNGSDLVMIKTLTKRHYNQWTSKMAFNGWELLEKYKDELEEFDITFSDVEKPDYVSEDRITDKDFNLVNIVANEFKILNPTDSIKKAFNKEDEGKEIKFDFNLANLYKLLPFFQGNELRISKEYFKFINMYLNLIKSEEMFSGFKGHTRNFNFELKPFQAVGCLYMLLNKRMILGDEMGLGKTIQALSSVEISKQKPCIIVCPSTLKLNWLNEIEKNFKNQKIEILNKKSKKDADYYIINYESLHKYFDLIEEIKPRSAILDESHYVKNKKTKRTTSCLKAIKNIEYRFALTGTAILKSPSELISQLKVINRLDHFGCENTFIEKFCGNSQTQWGNDIRKGASNLNILNRELRESCFLRREKDQVTKDLPDKMRSYIYLDNVSKKYKSFMEEFSRFSHRERLDKIEYLRMLAAEDKLESLKEWINNFQQTEKKLVVFAYHRKIQNELLKAYPDAASILSDMSDQEKNQNKERFMKDDSCKLIICSLKSASVGLTLTSASDVLFAEMDWCAANNIQAEDRCHRIGQKNNVNIWYLITKNTIEENILNVVSKKMELFSNLYNSDIENDICKFSDTSTIEEVLLEMDDIIKELA